MCDSWRTLVSRGVVRRRMASPVAVRCAFANYSIILHICHRYGYVGTRIYRYVNIRYHKPRYSPTDLYVIVMLTGDRRITRGGEKNSRIVGVYIGNLKGLNPINEHRSSDWNRSSTSYTP